MRYQNRRQTLKGIGTTLALPYLPSLLGDDGISQAASQRMIFIAFGWGITKQSWLPKKDFGKEDLVAAKKALVGAILSDLHEPYRKLQKGIVSHLLISASSG